MKKQSFFHSLTPANRYVVGNLFFLYLIQGIYVIMIGSILPAMKVEYGLDYQAGVLPPDIGEVLVLELGQVGAVVEDLPALNGGVAGEDT